MEDIKLYDSYLKSKQLSWEVQQPLFEKYRRTKDPKVKFEIRQKLWVANLLLVPSILRKLGYTVDLDMIQECNMALERAIEKFNLKRGVRFSSYASLWIRAYAANYTHRRSAAGMRSGRSPPPVIISSDVHPVPDLIEDTLLRDVRSSAEHQFIDREERSTLFDSLKILSPKELEVMKRRVWNEQTLEEIGRGMGFSRERARQLEIRSTDKIQAHIGKKLKLKKAA